LVASKKNALTSQHRAIKDFPMILTHLGKDCEPILVASAGFQPGTT